MSLARYLKEFEAKRCTRPQSRRSSTNWHIHCPRTFQIASWWKSRPKGKQGHSAASLFVVSHRVTFHNSGHSSKPTLQSPMQQTFALPNHTTLATIFVEFVCVCSPFQSPKYFKNTLFVPPTPFKSAEIADQAQVREPKGTSRGQISLTQGNNAGKYVCSLAELN